jgi:hypothetical protein
MKLKKDIDRNGNTIIRVQTRRGGFSVQTNGNLPFTHDCARDRVAENLDIIAAEIRAYVGTYGTTRQKAILAS